MFKKLLAIFALAAASTEAIRLQNEADSGLELDMTELASSLLQSQAFLKVLTKMPQKGGLLWEVEGGPLKEEPGVEGSIKLSLKKE